jgi:hypothetical protein
VKCSQSNNHIKKTKIYFTCLWIFFLLCHSKQHHSEQIEPVSMSDSTIAVQEARGKGDMHGVVHAIYTLYTLNTHILTQEYHLSDRH